MYPDGSLKLNYETREAAYFFTSALDPLNNWSAHQVKLWDKVFPTSEHGYHWRKFFETAPDVAAQILAAPSPWAAKLIERVHQGKQSTDWDEIKVSVMRELLVAKLAQNDDIRACLESTGRKTIVENSPWDSFWGAGPDGRGENMLGKLWMELRDS